MFASICVCTCMYAHTHHKLVMIIREALKPIEVSTEFVCSQKGCLNLIHDVQVQATYVRITIYMHGGLTVACTCTYMYVRKHILSTRKVQLQSDWCAE